MHAGSAEAQQGVAQPAQTEEQRLKAEIRAAKLLRKQQWEQQQQLARQQEAGDAVDAEEDASDDEEAAEDEPEQEQRRKSNKAASTSDVVSGRQAHIVLLACGQSEAQTTSHCNCACHRGMCFLAADGSGRSRGAA